MRLFGGGKAAKKKTDTPQDSIQHMKSTADMLERKEQHLQSKIAAEESAARAAAAASNRSAALLSLKRRRLYEQQLEHTRGARFNLETQIIAIENANINLETLGAMRSGSAAMRSIHGSMDLDAVDATVDDIREQMDLAQEISAAIAAPMGFEAVGAAVDEEELLRELELLEQEEVDRSLLQAPVPSTVGAVGTSGVVKSGAQRVAPAKVEGDEEEEELRRLQASMMG